MFNKLKDMATNVVNKGENLLNKTVNRPLFERIVYAGYLIASADNDFDSDERKALVRLIKKDLPAFTTEDIVKVIKFCDNKKAFDKELGTQEIIDEIAKSASSETDAKQIMAVCAFIGRADGEYDKDEKLVALSICYALKLTPVHYGL